MHNHLSVFISCQTPKLETLPRVASIGDCFLGHPYTFEVFLKNTNNVPAKFSIRVPKSDSVHIKTDTNKVIIYEEQLACDP